MEGANVARECDESIQMLLEVSRRRVCRRRNVLPSNIKVDVLQRVTDKEWSSRTRVCGAALAGFALFLGCFLFHAAILPPRACQVNLRRGPPAAEFPGNVQGSRAPSYKAG